MTIKIVDSEVSKSMDGPHGEVLVPVEACRAVSVRADKDYIQALKVIAMERGKHVGDLVREILDLSIGSSIQDKMLFFKQNDYQNSQSREKQVNTGSGAA